MAKKDCLWRRIIMTTIGTLLGGISVAIFRNSRFGVDPFQCLCEGVANVVPIDFGTLYVVVNLVFLLFMFILYRHSIGVYTFFNMFFLGYIIDFVDELIQGWIPAPSIAVRIVLLSVGLLLVSLSAAFIFSSDLGVSTYDWVAVWFSEATKKIPFKFARIITDLFCCSVGLIFGVLPGIGTLLTAFCMGPFITFFRDHVTDPMLPKKPVCEKV